MPFGGNDWLALTPEITLEPELPIWDPHPEIQNTAAHDVRGQLPELADFARAVPDLTIILNHIGGLLRVGPYAGRDDEVLATWRAGIAAVAECPNVYVKLGGIGQPRTGYDWYARTVPIGSAELADSMAPYMEY
jgi:predicted TIM-barrel fold metal-dependent hydrolase